MINLYFLDLRHSRENHQVKVMAMKILMTMPSIKNADKPLPSSFSICFLSGLLGAIDALCFVFTVLSSVRVVLGVEYAETGDINPITASPINMVSNMRCRRLRCLPVLI